MLRYLRVGKREPKTGPDPIDLSLASLTAASSLPISLRSLNKLHQNIKQRIYRVLIPHSLLTRFDINPITWQGPDQSICVDLKAQDGKVYLSAWSSFDPGDPFYALELTDNSFSSIDLNFLILSDPAAARFDTDIDPEGAPTMFGTVRRNLQAEEDAMVAGLAPGQIRAGLRGSGQVIRQIETLLIALGHRSVALEPLTYVSAWVFERRGFAYVFGHQLMKTIHEEFQPGGQLHAALDGSTPFRQPDQWKSVRGRAWAIHDGILEVIDKRWDGLRMAKQVGRHAGVDTFPDAVY